MNNPPQNGDILHGKEARPFPVVAIGASAGGLEAVTELMQNLPIDTGMAFVYIQHLDRSHESALVPILRRATLMNVFEVQDGTSIQPNHLFIIPPNTDMTLDGGVFKLSERAKAPIKHSPVDLFFISLAEKRREGSIGIVLSGTASDGSLGLKAIKEAGGITFAQDESALFQSMPKTAIGEGIVDAIMSPGEMAQELARLSQNSTMLLSLIQPDGLDEGDMEADEGSAEIESGELKKILRLVRTVTGVDFTHYKQNTIKRRIIRRMLLHKLNDLPGYVDYLKQHNQEVNLLYKDLLINVTHFFRDREATDYLKKELLPELLKNRSSNDPLRIWVPACATGEEAYSLAIMLSEIMGGGAYKPFQIFATDLSETAIAKARLGLYTTTDVMQLSKKRLDLFFTMVDGHFRINKSIRDFCVFAPHNILKDPPFSRVDLISCCNLLIYLDTVLQRKVLGNFHYALNRKGYLILGKSETIGSSTNLFSQADRKAKIYIKKAEAPSAAIFDLNYHPDEITERMLPKLPAKQPIKELTVTESLSIESVVDGILLAQYVPPGVVVNFGLDIVQFRGATGLFLEPSPGKASLNLLKMVRNGLELELRNAAHKVIKSGEPVKVTGLDITHKGNIHHLAFEIIPLVEKVKEKLLLIIFEEVKTPSPADLKANFSKDRRVKQLENELMALREDMGSLVEEQETANEELQSANEEIVSSNEELQSINEELETSKEELESSNEELLTINQELQVRNDQLSESYDYTEKVIETIREAVIVLDSLLLVRSANKAFYRIFNTKSEETEGRLIYEISNG
ncbi:MAG: CheR family methyltransferase, partial [Segetibacter sp.]